MNLLKKLRKKMLLGGLGSNNNRTGLKPSPALKAALEVITEKLADDAKVIGYEFERLKRSPEAEWRAMEVSVGAHNPEANRYINVVPFDETRVVLAGSSNDYINASFVSSKSPPHWTYIAAQGPLAGTAPQFWQMVFDQGSAAIIMLTRTHEKQVEKCAQYFPTNLHEEAAYGDPTRTITVRVAHVQDLDSDICMRELTLTDSRTQTQHHVRHYHYHRCRAPLYCMHLVFAL